MPLEGSWGKEVPEAGEVPSLWEDKLGQKRSFRGSNEGTISSLWQACQSGTYTDGPCHPSIPLRLKHMSAGMSKCWVQASGNETTNPGRGLLLAVWRQPEGQKCRAVSGRSPGRLGRRTPLLSGMQRAGSALQPPLRFFTSASTGSRRSSYLDRPTCPSCSISSALTQPEWVHVP